MAKIYIDTVYKVRSSMCSIFLMGSLIFGTSAFCQDFSEDRKIPEDAMVYMERTQCYGTCPVYSFYVLEDGTAHYEGVENVEAKGNFVAQVTPEKLEDLVNLFYQYRFFEFENRYVDLISDLPTTYIYFAHNENSKKITDYHGAPDSLKMLEKEVDMLMKSLDWEKEEN